MANEFTWAPSLEKILWDIARAAKEPTKKRRYWTAPLDDDAPARKPGDLLWSGGSKSDLRKRQADNREQIKKANQYVEERAAAREAAESLRQQTLDLQRKVERLEKVFAERDAAAREYAKVAARYASKLNGSGSTHEH
jgi:hypothetical protein